MLKDRSSEVGLWIIALTEHEGWGAWELAEEVHRS